MDGCKERPRARLFTDALRAFKNSRLKQNQKISDIAGNAVIIQYLSLIHIWQFLLMNSCRQTMRIFMPSVMPSPYNIMFPAKKTISH